MRRLWFCVWLYRLPIEASRAGSGPRAVVEERQGIHRVVLANEAALGAGVQPGQSANAALALLPGLELEERCPLREQQSLESLAAWLERYSSFVTIAGSQLLLLEIAGSLRLFGGLQSLRQQVSAGLEQQGFSASLAIAPTPLAATWLARSKRRACVQSADNLVPMLRPLPLSCLDWPAATVDALSGMGVSNIGDCLRLPREGFARRLGAKRLLELDRALGRLPDPRTSWRAPEAFCADYEMTEEQSDRELLLAICRELLERHEQFLLVRQLGTQRIRFSFYHLKAPATQLALGCVQAERTAARWFDLLNIRFERVALPEPVIAVRLEGGRTQALATHSARLAFDERAKGREHLPMTQLAERLAARIGAQSVSGVTTHPEHRPQYAWRPRNLLAGKVSDALSFVRRGLRRPLWMLPEPAPLHADSGHPLHFGRLTLLEGPERLETGWWDEHGIARDYYTAVNPRGMRLWVFRNRNAAASWYLHGIFG
ncbi:MAG: DNA polymerase Y family protein [Woeseiaceae bacterium]|nr:DNA polymerase Y family protein [Woeseiaceae bacterium]